MSDYLLSFDIDIRLQQVYTEETTLSYCDFVADSTILAKLGNIIPYYYIPTKF